MGLNIGICFAEISARKDKESYNYRWYLPKKNLASGIKDFFVKYPQISCASISVTTQMAHQIVHQRLGTSIALLVTAGFEHWPMLRQPVRPSYFSLLPYRDKPLVGLDHIFGISERTNAQGEILTSVNLSELEFLIAKLELLKIKSVAIGFLHSQMNSKNEIDVANFLKEKGFQVICSHQEPNTTNEVGRWWRTILNTYISENFQIHFQQIKDSLSKESEVIFVSSENQFKEVERNYLYPTAFGFMNWLCQELAPTINEKLPIIYFGLEKFLIIYPQQMKDIFQSNFGPIAVTHLNHQELTIQPYHVLENNIWKNPDFKKNDLNIETGGAMLFGKGLTPAFLDLFVTNRHFSQIEGISEHINDKIKTKIQDGILVFGNQQNRSFSGLLENLLKQSFDRIALDICFFSDSSEIIVTGPLGSLFAQELKPRLPHMKLINCQLYEGE